ncbi:MAG: GIY-YIG nuclease family protein [Reyranellaceae bacterium]
MGSTFFVYIMASKPRGTLYVGVTGDLMRRVWEHRNDAFPGFTREYQVKRLVWYEQHETAAAAIQREKRLKKWKRDWKIELVEKTNLDWDDLYERLGPA